LSKPTIRDTNPRLTNRSVPLRLMESIIAVLLAITMAVFPITMPHTAAMPGVGHHPVIDVQSDGAPASDHEHLDRHDHAEAVGSCDPASASTSGAHESSCEGSTSACCGIGMCHAFQVSAAPLVDGPDLSAVTMVPPGDEQVDGTLSGRLDRPPRTV
jgi:hypothetical protein